MNSESRPNLRELAYEMATQIMKTEHFVTLNGSEEVYHYREGMYKEGGELYVKAQVQKLASPEDLGNNLVNEVIGNVKRSTYQDVKIFYEPSPYVVVKNGLLNVETGVLESHSPDHYALSGLPVDFASGAWCPQFEKFLTEVLYEEDIPAVQEWFGYCLHRGYPAQVAMLFVGEGNNGKSTLIGVLKTLLGKDNYASASLQELELYRFTKADLFGKLANLYADLSDSALKSVGTFKMLTGGDPIRGEHKFANSFVFENHAKLTFSCNVVPEVYEDTTAFFRRWMIIQFPHTFDGEKADKDLLSRLTAPEELSGVLNWALLGLKRLRSNKWTFTNSRSTEEVRLDYIRRSSPMKAFITDAVSMNPVGIVAKQRLFEVFVKYCERMKLAAVTSNTFFQNLPLYFARSPLQSSREDVDGDGKRKTCFRGLELRSEEEWGKPISEETARDIKIEKPLDIPDSPDKTGGDRPDSVNLVNHVKGSPYFNVAGSAPKTKAHLVFPKCEDCGKDLGKGDEPTAYTLHKKHYCKVHFLARKEREPERGDNQS